MQTERVMLRNLVSTFRSFPLCMKNTSEIKDNTICLFIRATIKMPLGVETN